jgi:protein TonB
MEFAPPIAFSSEARRAGVEGTVVARCLITDSGTVRDCELLKGLPLVDAAVLASLRARSYAPARIDGRPVSVRHVFTIHLKPEHQ